MLMRMVRKNKMGDNKIKSPICGSIFLASRRLHFRRWQMRVEFGLVDYLMRTNMDDDNVFWDLLISEIVSTMTTGWALYVVDACAGMSSEKQK